MSPGVGKGSPGVAAQTIFTQLAPGRGQVVQQHSYRGLDFTTVGRDLGGFEKVDKLVFRHLRTYNIPNATLALFSTDGRLVYCKGFTNDTWWAQSGGGFSELLGIPDRVVATPWSRFRWASVSKLFTATAVMQQVQAGRLSLDTKVFTDPALAGLWADTDLPAGRFKQSPFYDAVQRLDELTLLDLLTHGTGWLDGDAWDQNDPSAAKEPSYNHVDEAVADFTGTTLPVSWQEIIGYCFSASAKGSVLRQFMEHSGRRPGQYGFYTNLGVMLLGRIVAHVTGTRFKSYMEENVFGPLGARFAGYSGSTLEERVDGEVPFFDLYPWPTESEPMRRLQTSPSVMESRVIRPSDLGDGWREGEEGPTLFGRPDVYDPYGSRNRSTFAPAGGLLATGPDVLKLLVDMRPGHTPALLSSEIRDQMLAPWRPWASMSPDLGMSQDMGLGWKFYRRGARAYAFGHSGHMDGTEAGAYVITGNPGRFTAVDSVGMGVAYATNRLNKTYSTANPGDTTSGRDLGTTLRQLLGQVSGNWLAVLIDGHSSGDLWEVYR